MSLTHCPICGSELECSTTPGKVWCCSPECGACVVDIDTAGVSGRYPAEPGISGSGQDDEPKNSPIPRHDQPTSRMVITKCM